MKPEPRILKAAELAQASTLDDETVVDAVRDLIPTADPQEQEKSSASPDNKESATRSP